MKRTPWAATSTGRDRWLVSYADLVTLLLAFFVALYAASTVDAGKLTPSVPPARDAPAARERTLDAVQARIEADLRDVLAGERLDLTRDARGVVLSLPEQATFPVGSADPTPEALALIARVARTIQPLDSPVRIEGHTDDAPIRTARYGSNWELSTARASAVIAYLVDDLGFDPARLSAAGYGEFHPRVPNDSVENRARNRRIDLVVETGTTAMPEGLGE